jgi:hypothetical protein
LRRRRARRDALGADPPRAEGYSIGAVVGATWPQDSRGCGAAAAQLVLLPGVGAQGARSRPAAAFDGRGPALVSRPRRHAGLPPGAPTGSRDQAAATFATECRTVALRAHQEGTP